MSYESSIELNCSDFERKRRAAVEARAPADSPEMWAHAVECAACRERWEQDLLLEEIIPDWREGTPDVDLVEAVLARRRISEPAEVRSPAAGYAEENALSSTFAKTVPGNGRFRSIISRNATFKKTMALGAVAAAILVLVVRPVTLPPNTGQAPTSRDDHFVTTEPSPSIQQTEPPVRRQTNETDDAAHPAAIEHEWDDGLAMLARDMGAAYLVLAHGAADAVTEPVRLTPSVPFSLAQAGPDEAVPEAPFLWDREGSGDLSVVTEHLDQAIRFFLNAFLDETAPTG